MNLGPLVVQPNHLLRIKALKINETRSALRAVTGYT